MLQKPNRTKARRLTRPHIALWKHTRLPVIRLHREQPREYRG